MNLRRTLAALATPLLALAALPLASAPAHAEGTCTLSPPARIVVFRQVTVVPTSVVGDCVPDGIGRWILGDLDAEATEAQQSFTDPDNPLIFTFGEYLVGLGPQTWTGVGAWRTQEEYEEDCPDENAVDLRSARKELGATDPSSAIRRLRAAAIGDCEGTLTQNTATTDIRLAAAAYLSVARANGVVTLDATSLVYLPAKAGFVKRAGQAGEFQFREPGSTVWQPLKSVRTGSSATARLQYRFGSTRSYRFALYSTPSSFDVVSTTRTS